MNWGIWLLIIIIVIVIVIGFIILIYYIVSKNNSDDLSVQKSSVPDEFQPIDAENNTIIPGLWRYIDMRICNFTPSCLGQNPLSPYGRGLYPFLGESLSDADGNISVGDGSEFVNRFVGARIMNPNDSIVVWGNIPNTDPLDTVNGLLYWGFTTYLWEYQISGSPGSSSGIPIRRSLRSSSGSSQRSSSGSSSSTSRGASQRSSSGSSSGSSLSVSRGSSSGATIVCQCSVADSFSNSRITSRASGDQFLLIITPNENLTPGVIRDFFDHYQISQGMQIYYIIIPQEMYNSDYTYVTLSRSTLRYEGQTLPQYRTAYFKSKNNLPQIINNVYYYPRVDIPNERKYLDLQGWKNYARMLVLSRGYQIIQDTVTEIYLSGSLNGGVRTGYECYTNQISCLADNPDTAYFQAINFTINRETAIVVVALNHVVTLKANYSSVSFYNTDTRYGYAATLTGEPQDVYSAPEPLNILNYAQLIYNVPPDDQLTNGQMNAGVAERLYRSAVSWSVGSTYESILPMVVFVVVRK